jgi:hypothetical protein
MELRRGQRVPRQIHVSFASDDMTGTGVIYNLSREGCAIESETHMPMNSYLQMEIGISPDESPVFIEFAAVRWSTRTEFGAEFLTLREDSKARILKYLATAL